MKYQVNAIQAQEGSFAENVVLQVFRNREEPRLANEPVKIEMRQRLFCSTAAITLPAALLVGGLASIFFSGFSAYLIGTATAFAVGGLFGRYVATEIENAFPDDYGHYGGSSIKLKFFSKRNEDETADNQIARINRMVTLLEETERLDDVKGLELVGLSITGFPDDLLGKLKNLKILEISGCADFADLTDAFVGLNKLKTFSLSGHTGLNEDTTTQAQRDKIAAVTGENFYLLVNPTLAERLEDEAVGWE